MRLGFGLIVVGLLGGAATSVAQESDPAEPLDSAAAEQGTIDPERSGLEPSVLNDSDLEATSRRLVAARWDVDETRIVVEWGAYSRGEPDVDCGVALLGSGSGGYWVVRFKLKSGGPASVRLRAGLLTPLSVASRQLQRGEVLTAEDMAVSVNLAWGPPRLPGVMPSEGWIVQRVMASGDPLREPAVRPPLAVVSGHSVELIWEEGAIGLRMPGTAAGSAVLGETVFVRTESGQRLRGVAVAPGTVNVTRGGTK